MQKRTVLHVDLNNFFASVETLYNPALKNGYTAVCGSIEDRHGIVLAKNQKAKLAGVKTGMTIREAEIICPGTVFVEAHHERYSIYSKKAKKIYADYTDKIESFGIDECWLDVTESKIFGSGKEIADKIRERTKKELGLTVSVGVSFNKIFAKLGSDMKKPDGTTEITEENYREKVWPLPVGDLLFVGHATLAKLKKLNINTIGELAETDLNYLTEIFGKWGETLWVYANGKDESRVLNANESEDVKSVGNSLTCYRDLKNEEDVKILFAALADSVSSRVINSNAGKAATVTISVRDENLFWITRQGKLSKPSVLADDYFDKAMELFRKNYKWTTGIRSLGISVSGFISGAEQIEMDDNTELYEKKVKLAKTVNGIRDKYGISSVLRGILYKDKKFIHGNTEDVSNMPPNEKTIK